MSSQNLHKRTITKLVDSEAAGGVVEFEATEADLAGAFVEDAIGDDDLDELDDSEARDR